MTRKKGKASEGDVQTSAPAQDSEQTPTLVPAPSSISQKTQRQYKPSALEPSASSPTLVICRNKHWRYISSYHGPWLQLPPEVLQSLAYSNYHSPRPQPIDPAVFFDLVKIRTLVEDATSLAVRATNGTTSATLSSSMNAGNGVLNSSDAEIFGLTLNRGMANAKLSRERKHRMREHATQKLAHAYQLDEIAASVATMQSASALEDVAKLVLQRNESDPDAQYVHFFHEKIPSRAMAEFTTLDVLTDVILKKPAEGATFRTRAVTRVFKDDYVGAARDLTEGLAVFRLYNSQHDNQERDLVLARDAARLAREYRTDAKVAEKDQPSSLEPQMLFHRGGVYLTLACDQIEKALCSPLETNGNGAAHNSNHPPSASASTPGLCSAQPEKIEARRMVRTYAKRALRDYLSFLSNYDYTPGLHTEFTEAFLQKFNAVSKGCTSRSRSEKLLDVDAHSLHGTSDSLVRYDGRRDRNPGNDIPPLPKPAVHRLNALFAAVPPGDMPAYPPDSDTVKTKSQPIFSLPEFSEAVTYHPLLTDVLHSLLLCHCLIQTSPKEHLRHAYMAARVARVCDGYPIFLAARSPARADWVEVLRRTKDWLGLETSWDRLCAPASLPDQQKDSKPETEGYRRERAQRVAIRDALADDRVSDEESFRASVRARELRAAREEEEEQRKEYLRTSSVPHDDSYCSPLKRWAQQNGRDYPITTERAEAIARWIQEAPQPGAGGECRPKKAGRKGRVRKEASDLSVTHDLEKSVESLSVG